MKYILLFFSGILLSFCMSSGRYNNGTIQYENVKLTTEDKQILNTHLEEIHKKYDPAEQLVTKELTGFNYHTDAIEGIFHEIRGSLTYAMMLLDAGDQQYFQRAFEIIWKVVSLQDQDTTSATCGIWPYYQEEPLNTKKTPPDYNWADFNGVTLLDIWMGHQAFLPNTLDEKIKNALILAANAIQKRDVHPGYTNIAIMGTYVTYMVSHLCDLQEMQEYALNRLCRLYNYVMDKGGFSEYNSPTYTIIALDELYRMKRHMIEPVVKKMTDSLYSMGWDMIARHYHKPSGQWAGPHSRSYSTLTTLSIYHILKEASGGSIDDGNSPPRREVKIKHQIPENLFHYFTDPYFPRTETDTFENRQPLVIGTTHLTNDYALSSVSRSGFWNQRRPFLVYWGNSTNPKYLQLRFLHDFYDFCSASFHSRQKENNVLAGINLITNGGDKHISKAWLIHGKFTAKDLRLRFEFGNVDQESMVIPSDTRETFSILSDSLHFNIQLYHAAFDKFKGHWEKGGDGEIAWIDYILFSGTERAFNLSEIHEAILGFILTITPANEQLTVEQPVSAVKDGIMNVSWKGLNLSIPILPDEDSENL